MSHANAPLTPEGRLRLIERCQFRPIAHVAAEAGVSRACLSKWKARYDAEGIDGLLDRSSAPYRRPTQLAPEVVDLIETWRRDKKWAARKISRELALVGHPASVATVGRWLRLSRVRATGSSHQLRSRCIRPLWTDLPCHTWHIDYRYGRPTRPGKGGLR